MNFTDDTRAPLEFTKIRAKQMIVGCPNCKTGRSVSVDWWGSICSKCNTYFNKNTTLKPEECEGMMNQNVPINTDFTRAKANMEKKAYDYKEKVMDKRQQGIIASHEPDGAERKW